MNPILVIVCGVVYLGIGLGFMVLIGEGEGPKWWQAAFILVAWPILVIAGITVGIITAFTGEK